MGYLVLLSSSIDTFPASCSTVASLSGFLCKREAHQSKAWKIHSGQPLKVKFDAYSKPLLLPGMHKKNQNCSCTIVVNNLWHHRCGIDQLGGKDAVS